MQGVSWISQLLQCFQRLLSSYLPFFPAPLGPSNIHPESHIIVQVLLYFIRLHIAVLSTFYFVLEQSCGTDSALIKTDHSQHSCLAPTHLQSHTLALSISQCYFSSPFFTCHTVLFFSILHFHFCCSPHPFCCWQRLIPQVTHLLYTFRVASASISPRSFAD